jgi:hypothetical protein
VPPPLADLVRFLLDRVFWPGLLVVPAVAAIVAVAIVQQRYTPSKELLETIGLAVPSLAAVVALVRALFGREPFFIWTALLAVNFALRELDIEGTTDLVYVGVALLMLVAWRCYPRLAPYLAGRTVLTLLSGALFTYFLTATLDLRWWRFVPYEDVFEMRLEETMEIVGHLQLLALALLARRSDL